jgi:hypothetical protein
MMESGITIRQMDSVFTLDVVAIQVTRENGGKTSSMGQDGKSGRMEVSTWGYIGNLKRRAKECTSGLTETNIWETGMTTRSTERWVFTSGRMVVVTVVHGRTI